MYNEGGPDREPLKIPIIYISNPCSNVSGRFPSLESPKRARCGLCRGAPGVPSPRVKKEEDRMRGWRNAVGNLIKLFWLKKAFQWPRCIGLCMKNRGVRFHRTRGFKQYYSNSIPPTSHRMEHDLYEEFARLARD